MDRKELLEELEERKYQDITVGQLISQLVELPPMMPIFVIHHPSENIADTEFFTGISIHEDEDKKVPVLLIHASHLPEARRILDDSSYEEKVDLKREQARQMQYKKDRAAQSSDQYS